MSMEDGKGAEESLMARNVGRSTSADGEPDNQDVRTVDPNVWKRKHLSHATHNVARVLCPAMGALLGRPDAGDAHGVGRDSDKPLSLAIWLPSTRSTCLDETKTRR
jgi:hypothetical protein